MDTKIKMRIFGMIIFGIATALCINWYDYKLFILFLLFMWTNNIESSSYKK